jgi:hypothetical protein
MQTIMTLEGSTNPAMKLASLADPSRVSSSKIVGTFPHGLSPVATIGQPLRGSEIYRM